MAVQKPNGHEADDESLEIDQHRHKPSTELSRRGFLGALTAAIGATALSAACNDADTDDIEPEPPVEELTELEKLSQHYDINQIRKMIIDKYPDLQEKNSERNFRDLAIEEKYESDPLIQAYFLKVSFEEMIEDQVIWENDSVLKMDYQHPDKELWKTKMRKVCKNHKKDMEIAREKVKPYGTDIINYKKFDEIANSAVERVTNHLTQQLELARQNNDDAGIRKYDLLNEFTELIDADLLMGISIHEVMPVGYNDMMRIALLRALFENGFEINKIPAYGDDVASFGPMQMTVIPYEGRERNHSYGQETATMGKGKKKRTVNLIGDIEPYLAELGLPHQLHNCTNLEDQLVAGMLFQLTNYRTRFKNSLESNERFLEMWRKASLIEKRVFMATLLGTAHNLPANAERAIEQAVGWSRIDCADYFVDNNPNTKEEVKSLSDLRTAYINIAVRGHSTSGRHGRETSSLVDTFSRYNMDSVPVSPERIAEAEKVATPVETGGPVIEEPISPESPKPTPKPLLETREIKMTPKGPEGNKHYVYTVPNWKLSKLLETLCGSSDAALRERIKKHNKNTDKFDPGDVIWIPLKELQPELRDSKLVEYKIPKSMVNNKEAFVRSILKEGYDPDIALLYLPTKEALSDLNDLDGIVRLPQSIVQGND